MANFHSQEWFDNHLNHHLYSLRQLGYEVTAIFYLGSGNYGLDMKESDFDTIAFVTPTLKDICKQERFINSTIVLENGEAKVKDIRYLPALVLNQNPADIQLFNSISYYITSNYKAEWLELLKYREIIWNWNIPKFVCAVSSQAHKAIKECYNKLECGDDRYCWKKASIVLRCLDYICKINKDPYLANDFFTSETTEWKRAFQAKKNAYTTTSLVPFGNEQYKEIFKYLETLEKVRALYLREHDEFNIDNLPENFYKLIEDIVKKGLM